MRKWTILIVFMAVASIQSQADSDHAEGGQHSHGDLHWEEENSHDDHAHEREKNHGHKHEDEAHGDDSDHEHEDGGANVGPEKGILEASEENGIKLSKEAYGNFEIKTQILSGPGPWTIPSSARLLSGEEINIYRIRDQFIKRIDFKTIKVASNMITLQTNELRAGDEIVVSGVGFIRIAELAAFGGAPEGHSH